MKLLNYPLLIFVLTFLLLWFAASLGKKMSGHYNFTEELRSDFSVVLAASLTLLGLIIGFSFSMATGRYDVRKTYEEAEANAIGTEYVRADLLAPKDAPQVRELLKQYTDLRIQFYRTQNWDDMGPIDEKTTQIQDQLWATASQSAMAEPSPLRTLAVAGMNDVLNSQGYTQAAWWNRIPLGAWCLMFAIAVACNVLLGYGARKMGWRLLMVLPLLVSISFFLIADIDSPRGGVIRVRPQNLESLRVGLK